MTLRETLITQFLEVLGDGFSYYYDTDQIQNQMRPESECQYVHFTFRPSGKLTQTQKQDIFDAKLAELQSTFRQYEVCGGKAMWFGYILSIKLSSVKELEQAMLNEKLEYEQKIKRMNEQLEILKSMCVN